MLHILCICIYILLFQEDYVNDPIDGKWKGIAYFHPPAGKGKFIPLSILQPDERFAVQAAQVNR